MRRVATVTAVACLVAVLAIGFVGCNGSSGASGEGAQKTSGDDTREVSLDGSSTVEPIMSAIAEEFKAANPGANPTVGTSGTGGGFKKFCNGEIDIANASRPIDEEEITACTAKGIEFVELPIAFDGLSVVVNPSNTWATNLTVAELKKIWEPQSKVQRWSDVRAGFPNQKISLYGAGTDSGTFEYFTEAVVGKKKASRDDYQMSEDDNVLVTGVAGDKGALGYFGYAYYEQNKDKLRLVAINGVRPTPETIENGTYQPLSRPLFIYINANALNTKPQVAELAKFLLSSGAPIIKQVGYVPLPDEAYKLASERLTAKKTGSLFKGVEVGVKIQDVMKRESDIGDAEVDAAAQKTGQ